jgi:membrane protein required for colicin V production
MTLDLIVLALVVVGALFGARAGASRQLAGWGSLIAAGLMARPGAALLGSTFATAFHTSASLGAVAAGFATFIVVAVVVRLLATMVLRGVLAGQDPSDQGTDRALGFLLGAGKVLAVAWVALSALAFVEDNVQVAGKGLGLSPKDSLAFGAARKWNLFAAPAFSEAADLVKAQEVFRSPQLFAKVASDPAVAALQKNHHFRAVVSDPDVKQALERGDTVGLLKIDSVHQLLKDPEALGQLAALRTALERSAPTPKK